MSSAKNGQNFLTYNMQHWQYEFKCNSKHIHSIAYLDMGTCILGPGRKLLRTFAPAGYWVLRNYSPRQIIPMQIPVSICLWWDQAITSLDQQPLFHDLNGIVNHYKLALLLTASRDKAFLVNPFRSIQDAVHWSLLSIRGWRLPIEISAPNNPGTHAITIFYM